MCQWWYMRITSVSVKCSIQYWEGERLSMEDVSFDMRLDGLVGCVPSFAPTTTTTAPMNIHRLASHTELCLLPDLSLICALPFNPIRIDTSPIHPHPPTDPHTHKHTHLDLYVYIGIVASTSMCIYMHVLCSGFESHKCLCPDGFTGRRCEFQSDQVLACSHDENSGLICENGGICAIGLRNATTTESTILAELSFDPNYGFWHCQCPVGFVGRHCEVAENRCGDGDDDDDSTVCLHGASCVEEWTGTNTVQHTCDCSTIPTESHVEYKGPSCQYKTTLMPSAHPSVSPSLSPLLSSASTTTTTTTTTAPTHPSFCERVEASQGQPFCAHNGTCYRDDHGAYGCKCPEGYGGYRCHDSVQDMSEPVGLPTLAPTINTNSPVATQHVVCGNDEHVCLHGSQCVREGDDWQCDCQTNNGNINGNDTLLAGKHCQHTASAVCSADGGKGGSVMFCVNGGVCRDKSSCQCPDGFLGE